MRVFPASLLKLRIDFSKRTILLSSEVNILYTKLYLARRRRSFDGHTVSFIFCAHHIMLYVIDFIYRIYRKCLKTCIVLPRVGTYYLRYNIPSGIFEMHTERFAGRKFLENSISKHISRHGDGLYSDIFQWSPHHGHILSTAPGKYGL